MWPTPSHRIRLDELIAGSAGSQLISYAFENKELKFQLFHEGTSSLMAFAAATDTVHGRTVSHDPRRATCRIELVDLETRLFIQDGRYLPSTEPHQFRDHARDRIALAYGRRASEFRWLIRLQGEYPLLAFLVRDLADLHWTID